MFTTKSVCASMATLSIVSGETYFSETFDDQSWTDRWVTSEWKDAAEVGSFSHTAGNWFADEADKAIKTSEDARFYAISAKLPTPINNLGKDLVIQYLVKNEQEIDCGGSYLKLLGNDLDQTQFGGESSYSIMFGPDICGSNKKTHAILNYSRPQGDTESKNMDHQGDIKCESDVHAHLYTFVLKADNTYAVKIDNEVVQEGQLTENWAFQPSKMISDPAQSKPTDWVDDAKIPDPEDVKPENYDDISQEIPDPDASKPDDWDDDDDGEWEPPLVPNPEYQGDWTPKLIDNPDYKGVWSHPEIENPDYFEDDKMYHRCNPCSYVGMELWQVKAGTVFDDFLITDDIEEAEEEGKKVIEKIKSLKEIKEKMDEEEAAKNAEKMAEEDPAMTAEDLEIDENVVEKDEL
jgi:calreticulin